MAYRLMDCMQVESSMALYGFCSGVVASYYTHIVYADVLQILLNVLREVWDFAIAVDWSTHQGMPYMDVRMHFHLKGGLLNFHLMAIPLYEHHSFENMFKVLKRFLYPM